MNSSVGYRGFRTAGKLPRRSFLEIGSLALGGFCLSDLLRLRAAAMNKLNKPASVSDRSVILIWLQGGPSHIDTYDMKPEAPAEYRGEFLPIKTTVPGLEICEYLPRQAQIADKYSVIRSIGHRIAEHGGATGRVLTGFDPLRPGDHIASFPEIGSVVARIRRNPNAKLPVYISSTGKLYGGGSAYLGESCSPFAVSGDPNAPNFKIRNVYLAPELAQRLQDRTTLLQGFDRFRRELDLSGSMDAFDEFNQQALSLLTSDKTREAFDLSQETAQIRDAYGRHKWGQRALLARRLVEAGCSFVTMQIQNPGVGKSTDWDDHSVNWNAFREMRLRVPIFDRALAPLIQDLYDRGLDQQVLVLVMGEFGRTPRIEYGRPGQPGRNHWPNAMSVLVSGGGLRTGQVIGSTNANGELPHDRKLDPNDLLATVYRFMGIDTQQRLSSARLTPVLPFGEPIAELF